MAYRKEVVKPTATMRAIADNVENVADIDRLPCPYCNDQMWRIDNGDYPFDELQKNGTLRHVENYHCPNCGAYTNLTCVFEQSYRNLDVVVVEIEEQED